MGKVDLAGVFETFDGVPADMAGSWTRFRGPDFDNIVKKGEPLAWSWAGEGPEVLWSVSLGEGHAAPIVKDGRVYVMDYDEETRSDALRCFSFADGKEIWRGSVLNGPNGLYVHPNGNVYAASVFGNEITVQDPRNGKILDRIGPERGVNGPDCLLLLNSAHAAAQAPGPKADDAHVRSVLTQRSRR